MDFNKPSISKKIEKFLLENLKTEKEKESLTNVITGKSVLKGDAIAIYFRFLVKLKRFWSCSQSECSSLSVFGQV